MTPPIPSWKLPDGLRQALNLTLALAQPVTTVLCFALGTNFEEATDNGVEEPPIIPAGYTFIIWTIIYAGAIAYGVFQSLPAQRANPLLRRIGLATASAFLGTSVWLVMARFRLEGMTVLCIVWMMASLAIVLSVFVRERAPRSTAERWFVVVPLSIFAGYVTAATFANTAAVLKSHGWIAPGASETMWSIGLLLAAGGIGSWATLTTGGNAAYALTIVWALVGIVVANTIERAENKPVAIVAGLMAVVVSVALIWSRRLYRPVFSRRHSFSST